MTRTWDVPSADELIPLNSLTSGPGSIGLIIRYSSSSRVEGLRNANDDGVSLRSNEFDGSHERRRVWTW